MDNVANKVFCFVSHTWTDKASADHVLNETNCGLSWNYSKDCLSVLFSFHRDVTRSEQALAGAKF